MSPVLNFIPFAALFYIVSAEEPIPQPEWGRLVPVDGEPGAYSSEIPENNKAVKLFLPTPFPHIVRATIAKRPANLEFNSDASKIAIAAESGNKRKLRIEIAEKSSQRSDGRIAFSALDSKIIGSEAKLESHPGNHRVGFWNNPEDSVMWNYNASRWGMYEVAVTYSLASGTSKIEIHVGNQNIEATLEPTGSWYHYTTATAGRIYLPKSGKYSVNVKAKEKTGAAVMNLKALLLDPAPEGKPVVQKDNTITLHSRDSTVHGVTLRYEPAAKKKCLGYWSKPSDWASWDFKVSEPGKYKVIVRQGCGRGHGGSTAAVFLEKQKLIFDVEDTGGFQNWKDRQIGVFNIKHPGQHRLEVRPQNKKGVAVMDIQQITLIKN